MEDSFKVRVERLFGSQLFERVPKSSFPATSWSVTDGDVERRQWKRERGVDPTRDETPCSSVYDEKDGCFARKPRRKAVEEDDDEDVGDDGGGGEEEEIRASVGLDPTLDREDEEDEYDREAVGKEDTGDRIYMRDINDHEPFINYHSVVSDFFDGSTGEVHGLCRDPRADHFAANVRLNEDREVAENLCTIESSDNHLVPTVRYQVEPRMSVNNLKPILKRKENQMDVRPKKQVRFDPVYENATKENKISEDIDDIGTTAVSSAPNSSKFSKDFPGIPDYIRNPSKYICYTLDTSEKSDDELNRQAFEDFCDIISKSKSAVLDKESGTELPKSLVFTPRNKSTDAMVTDPDLRKDSHSSMGRATGIAAREACQSESCAMDEDELSVFVEEKNTVPRKMDRKYRSKASSDLSESQ